jgi:hypothetical protein
MKFKSLIFLALLFSIGLLNAQTDFRPGYIILPSGDTIAGKIDYRGDILMGRDCRFIPSGTDKELKYSPYNIIAYRFVDSKYFVSKEINGEKLFLEFLIKGKVNVYVHRNPKEDQYFIEKEGLGLTELPYREEIRYNENVPYEYRSTTHIGLLNMYMQDVPEFQSRIAKMWMPKQRWLIELAEDYHHKICKDESCMIFEKKLPFLKLDLELVGGMIIYNSESMQDINYLNYDEKLKNNKYFQTGVIAHLWLPTVNEKLFLKTGLLYSTFKSNNSTKTTYKIPIQCEYIYPKSLIRPSLAYGINLYKPFAYTVAITPGLNIMISRNVFMEIVYNLDFVPNYRFPLFPEKKLANSILAGLIIPL